MSETRKNQVKKSAQQSIKSFLSGRSLSTTSAKANVTNIGGFDAAKKPVPVATVRPVHDHDDMSPPIDLTKSPIISRSKSTLQR